MTASRWMIFRCDASRQIGIGHAMRCLALAQAWHDAGGCAVFLMGASPTAFEERVLGEGLEIARLHSTGGSHEDARETVRYARQQKACWVVADGYHLGGDFQKAVKDAGLQVLAIDDYGHAEHYYADLVLNQNSYAQENLYPQREPYTRLLLGVRYALLRREFLRYRDWTRQIPDVARNVLVTLGGADADNVTIKVIEALKELQLQAYQAVVVVGASNPHLQSLQEAVHGLEDRICLRTNVTDMPELMAWADVAVTASGSTSWEVLLLRLPACVLVLAPNQRPVAADLAAKGVAINLGEGQTLNSAQIAGELQALMQSPSRRHTIAALASSVIDGAGCRRVLEEMSSTGA